MNNGWTSDEHQVDTIKECKNVSTTSPRKKRAGGKAASKEKKQNVWGLWIDANREMGREDPQKVGRDLGAAKAIGKLGISDKKLEKLFLLYLSDQDSYLAKNGYGLSYFASRINQYTNALADAEYIPEPSPDVLEALRMLDEQERAQKNAGS